MRDERAGIAVLEELARRPLPEGVSLRETGTDGYGLLADLEEADLAIIVDCARMGKEPGTVLAFAPDEVENLGWDSRMSLHSVDLLGVVMLARQLGYETAIRIIGIEPQSVAAGDELSPPVAAAIPKAVELVLHEIETFRPTC